MTILSPSRRQFLAATGLAGAASLLPAGITRAAAAPPLAEEAFVWGLPLLLSGRYLEIARKAGIAFNRFYASPDLATPATHAAGAPEPAAQT